MEVDKEKLEELYVQRGRSARDVAEITGLNISKVYRLLDKYGIPRRKRGTAGPLKMSVDRRSALMENSDRQCKATRDDGKQCKNWAKKDRHYCRLHLYGESRPITRETFSDPLEWTDCRRIINGKPFTLVKHPFLEEIYRDLCPYIVIQKAAQMGVSEYALNRALWFCESDRGNVIYTLPTATDCSDFSKMRLNPIIDENQWDADSEHREVDNVKMKQIGSRFIVLKGSWDSRHAISIPSDMNVHDEVDFSKAGIINQYKARLGHSEFAWELFLSTPTLPESGVNRLFLETDQRHWYVTCPGCREEHCLCCGYPDLIVEGEYRCPKCGDALDRTGGRWIASFPEREKHGYHISRLMAPWATAADIVNAKKAYDRIKDFYNLELGLPYAGENVPLDLKVLGECEDDRMKLHVRDEACTAGVDQGTECFVVVSKRARNGKKQVVWVDQIHQDLAYQTLEQYMDQFKINTMVIDAMPNTASARKLAQKFPGRIFLCFYRENQKEPIKWDYNTHTVTVNRTETLARMCHRFHDHEIMMPVHEKLTLFKKHLTNLVTITEENQFTGEKIMKFTRTGDDHYAHANNYDDIAQAREAKNRIIVHRLDLEDTTPAGSSEEAGPDSLKFILSKIPDDVCKEFLIQRETRGKMLEQMELPGDYLKTFIDLVRRFGFLEIFRKLYPRLYNKPYLTDKERMGG